LGSFFLQSISSTVTDFLRALYKPYCRQQNGNRQQESHPGGNPSGALRLFRQDNRVIPVFSIKPAASVTPSGFAQAGRQGDVGLHVAARTDGGEDDAHRLPSFQKPWVSGKRTSKNRIPPIIAPWGGNALLASRPSAA
jgi:hypothetical protein